MKDVETAVIDNILGAVFMGWHGDEALRGEVDHLRDTLQMLTAFTEVA